MRTLLDERFFYEWVRKQRGEYDYWDHCGCPMFRYLRANGVRAWDVSGYYWFDAYGAPHRIPEKIALALGEHPRTYEALATRLRPKTQAEPANDNSRSRFRRAAVALGF
jgi:hypothetical protein